MDTGLIQVVVILAVAMAIAIAARRLRLPYTVGLVVVGAALAASKVDFGMKLTHDLVFDIILPPLLFEAALNLRWKDLRVDLLPVLALSTVGTVIAAGVAGLGMAFLARWPAAASILFGTLIAATDPVAVIAMFKDNRVAGRLRLLVEAESLFNDGVAAVLFSTALAWVGIGAAAAPYAVAASLIVIVVGGLGIGIACGLIAIRVAGHTSEHLIEAAITTVAAYGSFLLAEHLGTSGVLATVAAGMVMGNLGVLREEKRNPLTLKGREFALAFWEFAAFVANSVIFPLIGVNVALVPFEHLGTMPLITAICVVLLGRALTIYPLSAALMRTRWRIVLAEQHVLWWGGLRGALALALALSLPPSIPMHNEIVVAAFGVTAFSIVVQGLTMPFLLRRLGFVHARREKSQPGGVNP